MNQSPFKMLTVSQLISQFPAFYGNPTFTTAFTKLATESYPE